MREEKEVEEMVEEKREVPVLVGVVKAGWRRKELEAGRGGGGGRDERFWGGAADVGREGEGREKW